MKTNPSPKPVLLASKLMALEIISDLLSSASPDQTGRKLTEQIRELTGAHTVMLVVHPESVSPHEVAHICPSRRADLFSPDELEIFCLNRTSEALPRFPGELPSKHPLRAPLLRIGVKSILRFPLYVAEELLGFMLLLDLPESERIDEVEETLTFLAPMLATALKNALSHKQVVKQAQELEFQAHDLERRVAERTADLEAANIELKNSRLAALNMMEDAVAARNRAEGMTAELQREINERKRAENIMQARFRLLEFANSHSMAEFLTATLDEIEALTGSKIGFFHFLEPDQKTLKLQSWSTNTVKNMCTAEGEGSHYNISQAGIWVDCVHERCPVIHNDYASLPHRKGMPVGHAPVIREATVPIIRGGKIHAIVGIGNKETDYNQDDIKILTQLGDLSWEIAKRKEAEYAFLQSEKHLRSLMESAKDFVAYRIALDSMKPNQGRVIFVSPSAKEIIGTTEPDNFESWLENILDEDMEALTETSRKAREKGETFNHVVRIYHPRKKQIRWINIISNPVTDTQKKIVYSNGLMIDITDRILAQQAMRDSEERYRLLFENSHDAIMTLEPPSWNFTTANPATITMFKLGSQEEFISQRPWELSPERQPDGCASVEKAREMIGVAMREGYCFFEWWHKRLNGEEFPATVLLTRMEHAGQQFLQATIRDNTERKRAEENLLRERARLKTSLNRENLIADIASRLNSTGAIYNNMGELLERIATTLKMDSASFYKFDADFKVALRIDHWVSGSCQKGAVPAPMMQASKAPGIIKRILANKMITIKKFSELKENESKFFGTSNTGAAVVSPISLSGSVKGYLFYQKQEKGDFTGEEVEIIRTITDIFLAAWERDALFKARLEAERKQVEAVRLAEEATRLSSIGIMAGGIIHEINQPLNVIKIAADSLSFWNFTNKNILPAHFEEWFEKISCGVDRIDQIIKHMRAFWVPSDRKSDEAVDFSETVRNALSLIDTQLISHGIQLEVKLRKTPLMIQGDRIHLEQILINLVVNSMHALDQCKKSDKKITIITRRSKRNAVLEVIDNGMGLPIGAGEKIFDPFFSTKRAKGGSGLGLAIVKSFTEEFGGSVGARNNKTGGATFTIQIPHSTLSTEKVNENIAG